MRAYAAVLDAYPMGDSLTDLQGVLPDHAELAATTYERLDEPSPAKLLQLTRLRTARDRVVLCRRLPLDTGETLTWSYTNLPASFTTGVGSTATRQDVEHASLPGPADEVFTAQVDKYFGTKLTGTGSREITIPVTAEVETIARRCRLANALTASRTGAPDAGPVTTKQCSRCTCSCCHRRRSREHPSVSRRSTSSSPRGCRCRSGGGPCRRKRGTPTACPRRGQGSCRRDSPLLLAACSRATMTRGIGGSAQLFRLSHRTVWLSSQWGGRVRWIP